MTPPTVLLDESFLRALVNPAHADAVEAHRRYDVLVDRFVQHEIRLRSREDHLGLVDPGARASLLAPVEPIHVSRQFHRQAARLELPEDLAALADDDARVTLVVMRRERIEQVASFHPAFDALAVTLH